MEAIIPADALFAIAKVSDDPNDNRGNSIQLLKSNGEMVYKENIDHPQNVVFKEDTLKTVKRLVVKEKVDSFKSYLQEVLENNPEEYYPTPENWDITERVIYFLYINPNGQERWICIEPMNEDLLNQIQGQFSKLLQ
ncbi:hypothetical protein [Persicobacter sp. CCB-QB2]|uniref:hypothetical protein n=1 Tax=Persicobacter sp. CCB-QB2 TaxID=1561025 RepID=UPI0012F7F529|nr:hypothetical protein [Persicobacter sp. CCB-QB2]